MLRIAVPIGLLLAGAGILSADQAATFFDDASVKEIRIYFDNANWYDTLFQSHSRDPNDPYFPARFESSGVVLNQVGVRFKGNSSFQRNGVKKPFKIDFNEYDGNATFLGLKKLNLHNGDLQPSHLHEKLFLEFAGKFIAAMRAVHVRLYVNDAYYGLYLAVEQPDKTMMQSRFGDDEDGNLYEAGENVSANMSYLGPNPASYYTRYELKTNETQNDYSGLIQLLDILNNTATAELPTRLEPVLDLENVLRGMALNALFTNVESYLGTASEYFLYQRSRDNRFVHIHWDTNETFGSTGDGTPRISNPFVMDPFYLPSATGGGVPGGGGAGSNARPLLEKLWAVDGYKRFYLRSLARMLREGFDVNTFTARVTEMADRIRSDYYADSNKAFTNGQFETGLNSAVNVRQITTYGLTQFVRERYNFLRPYLNALAQPADVRLNELVTVNVGAHRDTAGDADPWLELYNLGPGPVALTGFYLTDDPAVPTKWVLPTRTLADGEFLVLWLDGETNQGDTHASFRAPAAGGSLYLYSSAAGMASPLDTLAVSALAAGQSLIRATELTKDWTVTTQPTAGAANVLSAATSNPGTPSAGTGQLLINEIMADNDGSYEDPDEPGAYEDWFEIYNPGASTVDMSGMYLTDNLTNFTKFKIPDGVTIPAGGYLVFMADSEPAQGSRHTNFALSADGEAVGLYAADGRTVIDSVTFGTQQTDIAYGRTTDAADSWSVFRPGTPGKANANAYANWMVNGGSFAIGPTAPSAVVSAFVANLSSEVVTASSTTLPEALSGVAVTLTDSAGVNRNAPLYFVSPTQTNFLVPAATAPGRAKVSVRRQDGGSVTGDLLVDSVAPALFSANANGQGVGLLAGLRVSADGTQTSVPAFAYDAAQQAVVAVPVSLGAETDKLYLVLYGTGIRGVSALSKVTMEIGGVSVPVLYAAAQSEYPGLDQVNVGPLPRSLAGKGSVTIVTTVDGRRVNRVTVAIE